MDTTREPATTGADQDTWCAACAGTGVIDDWHPTGVDREPRPCQDCDGAGWFDTDCNPADPPAKPSTGRCRACEGAAALLVILGIFGLIAFSPWLVENCWPAVVLIAVGLLILERRLRAWTR